MTNAIFTMSESSVYDDQPEVHYHFPSTYLRVVEQAMGDWIIYYEPRRNTGPTSNTGRMAYFAIARVDRVAPDERLPDHYYAYISDYLEFDLPVPFREGDRYFESALSKSDGSTNKGAFGRAVRLINPYEFESILEKGFASNLKPWELIDRVAEPVPESVERPIVSQIVSRKFRDDAFRRHVREAYANTCAVTGLRLTNGGGRPEVQAAHIRPVEFNGPDTVRNGLALTATVHWMFDRGLISVDESFRIIVSRAGLPAELASLVQSGKPVRVPERRDLRPHHTYLSWHRRERFKV
jgi:putative restriction endonuclease